MPIELRLNIAIGILLALMLAGVIALTLASATPRIEAESRSAVAMSRSLVEMSIATLRESPDPEAGVTELTRRLEHLRHVNAVRRPSTAPLEEGSEAVPVLIGGRDFGAYHIMPRPDDEIAEIWQAIRYVVTGGAALLLASIALTTWIVRRALAPVGSLVAAMRSLGAGHYEVAIAVPDAPELAVIARGMERLARALGTARAQNRSLTRKLVDVQDDERRDLARELHDEIGPHLFAVRAMGTTLKRSLDADVPDIAAARKLSGTILAETDVLQQSNRRVLQRLAPVGLAELGLAPALEAMVAQRREQHLDKVIEFSPAKGDLTGLDDATRLTVYRVVQEGLTNSLRHAEASRIEISIARETGVDGLSLVVRIRDDGHGSPGGMQFGHGLTGMQERIEALGGSLNVGTHAQGGLLLAARLPIE